MCADPPDEPLDKGGLPEHVIYEVLVGVETSMLIDINLSDQNRRVTSKTVTLQPDGHDFAVNAPGFSVPSFAQLRLSSSDSYREPVDVVNLASIDRAGQDSRLAVAFYGTPLRARLSWLPQAGESQELTLWYDKTVDQDGALADEPPIESAYTEHLKLQAAAQCMELMNRPVGDVLKMRIQKGEDQWRRYVRMGGQQGVIQKPSSHPRAGRRTVGRFQRPGGGWL